MPQTLKDVSRERFDVNKEPTEPSRCWSRIQALLLEAAVHPQTSSQENQEMQSPPDKTARPADAAALLPDTGGPRAATDSAVSAPAAAASPVTRAKKEKAAVDAASSSSAAAAASAAECAEVGEAQMSPGSTLPARGHPEAASADAAGGSGFTGNVGGGAGTREVDGTGEGVPCEGGEESSTCTKTKSPVEAYVDQCAWRVLHAASRTASGGDSFFVVQVRHEASDAG